MSIEHVCVIGGGIVGTATAYVLAQAGHRVTLLDEREGPGLGASFANGAQLSYSYVEPLATPATLKKIPAMLMDPDSPLRFKPTGEWAQIRWGMEFLAACRRSQAERTTRALLELAFLSRDELAAAIVLDGLKFDHAVPGKLVVYDTEEGVAAARAQVEFQRALGCEQAVLSTADCVRREPALAPYAPHVKGGVWTPGEAVGDPLKLCAELTQRAVQRGAQVRWNTRAKGFVVSRGQVDAVRTDQGDFGVDAVVLANGSSAAALGRQLGLSLPVYPIKGYSITLPVEQEAKAPRVSVTDLRRKIVYAPLRGQLRIAGMAELVGHDEYVDERRIRFLIASARQTFPGSCDFDAPPQAWAGLRPATPTSMPIIGRAGLANAYVNVGQGSLGFTLAMGSARILQRALQSQRDTLAACAFAYSA